MIAIYNDILYPFAFDIWSIIMKQGIHPEYRDVLFHDTAANVFFVVGSTYKTSRTKTHQGKVYPYLTIDISSASHPFYTGKQHVAKSEGRIAKFNQRFKRKVE